MIRKLIKLEYLNCKYNKLSELPKDIIQLSKLRFLCCNNNQLIELPKGFNILTSLQSINFSYNNFKNNKNIIKELPHNLQFIRVDCL